MLILKQKSRKTVGLLAVRAHRQQLMSAFGAHYLVAVMSSASSASLVKQPTSFNFKMLNFFKKNR